MQRLPAISLVLALAACSAGEVPLYAPAPARSAILISLDTVRADRLGAYGYPRPTTPAMDRLAREGVLFRQALATSPWTLPSNASLLTGLYPHRHGLRQFNHQLPESVSTLPGWLADQGLRTFGIVSSHHLSPRTAFDRGFQDFVYVSESQWSSNDPETRELLNPGPQITKFALHWLREIGDEPFFLFLHYYDTHSDYRPEPPYRQRFVRAYDGPVDGGTDQLLEVRSGSRRLSDADLRHLSDLYDAELRQLDDDLAPLFDWLDASGRAADTVVVVTADHGEEFLEHGSVLHGRTYYEEVIAVPLVMRGPGIPRGAELDALVSLIDVPATLAALLGREVPEWMQGLDLSASWRDGAGLPERPFVLAEADWMNERPGMFQMLRTPTHKLVHEPGSGRSELYDLRADPAEQSDLAPREAERVAELRGRLDAFLEGVVTPERRAPVPPETLRALRKLGYVH